jgi:hypothetical protein
MEAFITHVRVRSAPETDAIGAAGRVGIIVGESVPSSSGVSVVGPAPDDFALAVMFDDNDDALWFRPELLEIIEQEEIAPNVAKGPYAKWPGHEHDPVHQVIDWLLRRLGMAK